MDLHEHLGNPSLTHQERSLLGWCERVHLERLWEAKRSLVLWW